VTKLPIDYHYAGACQPINEITDALDDWCSGVRDELFAWGVEAAWWWAWSDVPYAPLEGVNAGTPCHLTLFVTARHNRLTAAGGGVGHIIAQYGLQDWADPNGLWSVRWMLLAVGNRLLLEINKLK